jgi:hypothetical protein
MPIIENRDPLDARLDPDLGLTKSDTKAEGENQQDHEVLAFLAEAKRIGRTFQQTVAHGDWEQAQSAYRSEHAGGSKYTKEQYKNRAKYFKPKTRAAVRKNLTATAHALFASREVLVAEAENDSDPKARANASLLKEIIGARFNSKARKTGVPWFETALGARLDTQITASCCSKQTWRYKTVDRKVVEKEERPVVINGVAMIDQTGQPMIEVVEVEKVVKDVIEDHPEITLIPAGDGHPRSRRPVDQPGPEQPDADRHLADARQTPSAR